MYQYAISRFTHDGHISLIPEINQFFIIAVFHGYGNTFGFRRKEIRYEVHRSLQSREIAHSIGRNYQLFDILVGCLFLGFKTPSFLSLDAFKSINYSLIDGYGIFVTVFHHIVVKINRGFVAMYDDGIEMERIAKPPDDVPLPIADSGFGGSRRSIRHRVSIRDDLILIYIRSGRINGIEILGLSLSGTSRYAEVEFIYQFARR